MALNETGVITISVGAMVVVLGAALLFDKALIIAGNFLIVAGLVLLLKSRTFSLFKPDKAQGTLFFILGMLALVLKYALFGVLLEGLGLFMVFKGSIPDFKTILYRFLFTKFNKRD